MSRAFPRQSSLRPTQASSADNRKNRKVLRPPALQAACSSVVENLENRTLLTAASDGFVETVYNAQFTTQAAFASAGTPSYVTHVDTVSATGNNTIRPPDSPTNFVGGDGQPGDDFSGKFSTTIQVLQAGYYTFFPTTDDGAEIDIDGVAVGAQNLNVGRGPTEDTDTPKDSSGNPIQLAVGTHTFSFLYNNGGGGWEYQLRWQAGTTSGGTDLIPKELMVGAGAPNVANLLSPVPNIAPGAASVVGVNTNDVELSWSSHDVDAASFIIEQGTSLIPGGDVSYVGIATINSADGATQYYNDTSVTPGNQYDYEIISNSILGSTNVAAEPFVHLTANTPMVNSPPAAPLAYVQQSGSGNVVTFDTVPLATQYNILRSNTLTGTYTQVTGGTVNNTTAGNIVSFTDTTSNANKYYEVQAVNGNLPTSDPGNTGPSSISSPTTLLHGEGFGASYYTGDFNGGGAFSGTAQFDPNSLAAAPTFSTILPTINSGPIGGDTVRPPNTPTNFNSALAPNVGDTFSTQFDFTVVAPTSEQFTFLPRSDDGVQLTVDGVVIDAQGSRGATTDTAVVPVTWTAGSIHTVEMSYYQGGGGWEADLGWTSPTLTALLPGGFYGTAGQVVPQFDAQPLGVPTTAALATPPALEAPAVSDAGHNLGTITVNVKATEADTYTLFRGTSAAGPFSPVNTGSSYSAAPIGASPGVASYNFTDTSLNPNGTVTYYYYVVASNPNGSAQSNTISYTPVSTAPAAPTNVTATLGTIFATPLTVGGTAPTTSPIKVTWVGNPASTSYDVLRSTVVSGTPGPFAAVTGSTGLAAGTTSFTDTTALITAEYEYEVVARNSANSTGVSPGSTGTSAIVTPDHGVLEQFYSTSTNWGGATDNGDTFISGIVGNPTSSSEQASVNFNITDANAGNEPPPGGTTGSNYSTIFTGKISITTSGAYTFYSDTDDDGVLYVDGTVVAHGNAGGRAGGTVINLTGTLAADGITPSPAGTITTYDFQEFQEQGGGGHRAIVDYSGPDTSVANGTNPIAVPQSAYLPLVGVPATPGAPTATFSGGNVNVSFADNADNELNYALQRSSSPTFATDVSTVATHGIFDNGVPQQPSGLPAVDTATITDVSGGFNQTYYYRVVASNFNGNSVASAISNAVTTGAAVAQHGVEAHYYANEWWNSLTQDTTAPTKTGIDSQSPLSLNSAEGAELALIAGAGGDGDSGNISTTGASFGKLHPDPAGIIPADDYSDVFTGKLAITTGGTYSFSADTDDDGYLYIDGELVATNPGGHGPTLGNTTPIVLASNSTHDIVFLESNGGGGWDFHLLYTGPDNGSPAAFAGYSADPATIDNTNLVVPSSALTTVSDPVVTPTGFNVTQASDPTQATVTWNNNNVSAIRYVIQRSTSADFSTGVTTVDQGLSGTLGAIPASFTYNDTGLTLGQTYYYRMMAQNYDGNSAFTATVQIQAANHLAPVTPVTAVQDVNGHVDISFPAEAASGTASLAGYLLQRTVNNGTPTTVTTLNPGTTSYTDTAAFNNGDKVTYTVTAESNSSPNPANSSAIASNTVLYISGTLAANHPTGFLGQTDLSLQGNSYTPHTNTGVLQLTNGGGSEASSAFETAPVAITGSVKTSFDFQINSPNADGFTFTIQNDDPTDYGQTGGALGYANGPFAHSLGVAFNQYNGVTQVALDLNGTVGTYLDMSPTLGNAFHTVDANNNTDVFQTSIAVDTSTDATTGAVVHVVVRDTTTGLGYAHDFSLPAGAVAASPLFGANSADYVGFTAGTGGATSSVFINDWTFTIPSTGPQTLPHWVSGTAATWTAATDTLEVTGPGVTINEDPNDDTETFGGSPVTNPKIIVDAGQTLNIKPTADGSASSSGTPTYTAPTTGQLVHLGGLTLGTGANTIVDSLGTARTHDNHLVLVIGTVTQATAPTFSVSSGKLDLTDNDMIIHNGNYASVAASAAVGRNGTPSGFLDGTWTGGGLSSSVAAAVDADAGFEQNALAVVLNGNLPIGQFSNWQVGNTNEPLRVDGNDVIVKYTYVGDSTLSGAVDANAATIFLTFYGTSDGSATWATGDTNLDGNVDANDATAFLTLYGNGTAGNSLPKL